jgi:hypothetical protein
MRNFYCLIISVLFLFLFENSYSQRNDVSSALPNFNLSKQFFIEPSPSVESYMSRWYGSVVQGTTGIVKSFLNTPGDITLLSASSRALFGAARNSAGVFYAVEYTSLGAGNLVTFDTVTGNINTVAALSGLGAGHVVTGMAWDKTTNIMYVVSIDGTIGRLYTVNLATGVLTTVSATMAGSTFPIDIAINNSGVMYSCDVNSDALNTINKSTGAATLVGPLGININFAQGMAFDPETDSLFLAAFTDAGKLYKCNVSNGAVTLIGNFASGSEIDAFIIPPATNRQLNAFNLQSPSSGARIVTVAGSSIPVTITWDTSGAGASYKFIFGSPVIPPGRFTISSTINSVSTTLGALDALLAANGFTNNGSATDSAVGQWDVWAYKGAGAPGIDSLKSTNGPRAITLRRQQNSLSSFALVSPASGTTIVTSPVDLSVINFSWRQSGGGNTYKWLFKNALSYSDPATFRLTSNNNGFDTIISIRNSFLDSAIAGLGVALGDSIQGTWRVRSYSGSDSLNSSVPDRQLTLRRRGLLPLDQKFTETNFPPLFWSLEFTAPLYWSRETVSAHGTGVGSARFKYWSAENGVTQSLISNQFPSIPSGQYYLVFEYAYRFYLDGSGVLAKDSLGIFTSTDNGTTWTLFRTLIATETPQTGTNTTSNLTTASGSGEYTSPANNEWGNKFLSLPIGVNKVKFTAWSAYGNNLFIDNIYAYLFVGTSGNNNSVSSNFTLEQNYPNPFNPSTKINFSIPKQSFVTLKVFDLLGREVAQLVNKELSPANYSVNFNAAGLSSGIYFYSLETPEFKEVKRMILLK